MAIGTLLLSPWLGVLAPGDAIAIEKVRLGGGGGDASASVTVLLFDGRITAIGPEIAIPAGAERIDGSGLTAIPGFIDAFAEVVLDKEAGAPTVAKNDGVAQDYGAAAYAETAEASRRGLRPDLHARELLATPSTDALDKLRQAGFTAQLLGPIDGLLPGQPCLVELGDAPPRRSVVTEPGILLLKFRSGGGGGGGRGRPRDGEDFGYPTTLMGALAHLRQAFLDAGRLRSWRDSYRRSPEAVPRPPDDSCLDTLLQAMDGSLRVAFLVDRENDIRRALAFAEEFHLRPLIVGGKEAWKCTSELAAAHVPVIASLALADEPTRKGATKKKVAAPAAPAAPEGGAAKPAPDGAAATPPVQEPAPAVAAVPPVIPAVPPATPPAPVPVAVPAVVPAPAAAPTTIAPVEWEIADPVLAEPLELFEQREAQWVDEVENVERLLAAGVEVALTQRGSSNPGDFFADLRVAIEHGLGADAALAALTTTPARLLGAERELGRVRVGAPANLLLVEGDLAAKERAVRHLFIGAHHFVGAKKKAPEKGDSAKDGKEGKESPKSEPPDAAGLDLTGTWSLEGGGRGFKSTLTLKQDGTQLSGKLESEMGVADITAGSLEGDQFKLTISATFQNQKFTFTLSGKATKEELTGKFETPFGEPSDFTAKRGPGGDER